MCGLFGLLRCPGAGDPGRASEAFVMLGVLAEERGRDAAGGVDAAALRDRFGLRPGRGGTDSEAIFRALAGAGDAAARVRVLAALRGRAALAWADRARPGRVLLARAALSPLAVGIDEES